MDDCGSNFDQVRFLTELAGCLGGDLAITDQSAMTGFTHDWTGRFSGPALAVVRPTTTTQVSAVLRLCDQLGVAVLPQGGNTGLVGGSVPGPQDQQAGRPTVILSTTRLVAEQPVDLAAGTLEVGAGVTVARVQQLATAVGHLYGVDLASRDSATIGGTVATNAGGIRVCAFGMTRSQIVGLEAVLATGEIVSSLRGLAKDNTGYDLPNLLVGAEGTLGVVTRVLLQLQRPPGKTAVALIAMPDLAAALKLYSDAHQSARILAAEVMDRSGTEAVCALADLPWPLPATQAPYLLLLEWELGTAPDQTPEWIPPDAVAVLGLNLADATRLWAYRERQSEAAQSLPDREQDEVLIKLDISLPLAGLADFDTALRGMIDPAKLIIFGHLGDGNLHLEIAAASTESDAITLMVLEEVGIRGGSISAEHGVGRAKAKYLHLSRSPAEIEAMRAIKQALDPRGTLAPGVIFDS